MFRSWKRSPLPLGTSAASQVAPGVYAQPCQATPVSRSTDGQRGLSWDRMDFSSRQYLGTGVGPESGAARRGLPHSRASGEPGGQDEGMPEPLLEPQAGARPPQPQARPGRAGTEAGRYPGDIARRRTLPGAGREALLREGRCCEHQRCRNWPPTLNATSTAAMRSTAASATSSVLIQEARAHKLGAASQAALRPPLRLYRHIKLRDLTRWSKIAALRFQSW